MGRRLLSIVGTGMRAGPDTTAESRACIIGANKVLYLVADPLAAAWVENLNANCESLAGIYTPGAPRDEIYAAMVEKILSSARCSESLCVVFYGHPGVFVYPGHEAIRRAQSEGIEARMLPGISADARLFTDLGIDPGECGYQSYEATSFLVHRYRFDPRAALVLWQVGALGEFRWMPNAGPVRLDALMDYLESHYGSAHEVVLYEAACDPVSGPIIDSFPLRDLTKAEATTASTLYVPPKGKPKPDFETLRKMST